MIDLKRCCPKFFLGQNLRKLPGYILRQTFRHLRIQMPTGPHLDRPQFPGRPFQQLQGWKYRSDVLLKVQDYEESVRLARNRASQLRRPFVAANLE